MHPKIIDCFRFFALLPAALAIALSASCTKTLGWGLLLWSVEEPPIPAGTILPVYVKSNINRVWIAGIPGLYRTVEGLDKIEVPMSRLEFVGRRGTAKARSMDFSEYALAYAETLQDGLPIREEPNNSSRRVYRLRLGEVIKVLNISEGAPAISATGDPLPGDWYRVLTEEGITGYCFSYRLRFFEHSGGPMTLAAEQNGSAEEDRELEKILSLVWSPLSYGEMVSSGIIDLDELAKGWRFFTGRDDGIARIYMPEMDKTFSYSRIRPDGNRAWQFEGTSLRIELRSDNSLAVQYSGGDGPVRTFLFTVLAADMDDIILQEAERQEELFLALYNHGPVFTSANYGTLSFTGDGAFYWTDYAMLIPAVIPASALGSGTISMGLFTGPNIMGTYTGAMSLKFYGIGGPSVPVNFLYAFENQGLRVEYVPSENISGVTVNRRSSSPTIIYFYRTGN
ncbi:MAG: SH3 domain-containing protein [Treponema sp.]|jgi:hypothetical protein|nr:SH3 domain-containing protein [Treponema sp.]